MTEQELREKIVKILEEAYEPIEYGDDDMHGVQIYFPSNEDVANALILAGIGYVSEYKHRAELAEKELEEYKEKIKYGKLVEPVWFISHMNGLPCYGRVIGYQEDSGFVIEGTDCLISAEKIYLSEEQAEKELLEERKND